MYLNFLIFYFFIFYKFIKTNSNIFLFERRISLIFPKNKVKNKSITFGRIKGCMLIIITDLNYLCFKSRLNTKFL